MSMIRILVSLLKKLFLKLFLSATVFFITRVLFYLSLTWTAAFFACSSFIDFFYFLLSAMEGFPLSVGGDGSNSSSSNKPPIDIDLNFPPAPEPQAGPFPTKEEVERELFTFLSSFGSRDARKNVLKAAISKLDLNIASPEKRAKISQLMQELSKTKFSAYEAKKALVQEIKKWEKGGGGV